jgi:glycerol kinase
MGLSNQSDRRHVARAGLESIAYQIRDALEALRAEAGAPLRALHADGGATANKFLMQFTADLTGTPLHVASMADCSPLGAALAGLLGVGVFPSLADLAGRPAASVVFTPEMDSVVSRRFYNGWSRAVQQVLSPAS